VLFSISCQKPAPSLASAFSIFRTIQFGLESEDSQTIEHCAWITFYLLDAHSLILDKVLTSQVIVLIFQLLDKTESELLKPLLKIIGNIASGTDNQTNTLISFGILPKISKLTSSPILQVRKEVFFILSNILACTEDTALKVVQSDLITQILENTSNPEHQIKKYAILGLCNSTYQKSRKIFNCLKKVNVLWHLVNLLQSQEEQILFESLKALHNMLNRSKDFQGIENHSLFLLKFYELSGFDILDLLKIHRNERISRESLKILQDFSEDFLNLN
jgi:importin subunit alpha-2